MRESGLDGALVRQAAARVQELRSSICSDSLPVDVTAVANSLGYAVQETMIQQQGYIAGTEEIPRLIRIRRSDSPATKRFTLAHEIGHIVWQSVAGTGYDRRLYRAKRYSHEERIADRLAAELLMPHGLFRRSLLKYRTPSLGNHCALSRVFGVSMTACIRRIAEMYGFGGFSYLYVIKPGRSAGSRVHLAMACDGGPNVTFLESPSRLAQRFFQHALDTGRAWRGRLALQTPFGSLQVPAFTDVSVSRTKVAVRISSWWEFGQCPNSPLRRT